jgi:hypothetical protein
MKLLDRLLALAFAVVVAALAVTAVAPAIATLAVTGTICFVVIQLVRHFTSRF